MTTQPHHKCLMQGCTERVPASSEHGFCEKHEIIAVQLYRDLLGDVPTDRPDAPELDEEGMTEQELEDYADHQYDGVPGIDPDAEDEQEDMPDAPELDDEEQSRIETYLRHEGLSIDTPINLSAPSVAQQEPQEPVLVKCPYCSGSHQKYLVDACPLNPYRVR